LGEQKEEASRLTYSFGPFHLDPAQHRLCRDGRDLRLPPKVFETLVLLVERRGLLVAKDDLMKALWPGTFVEEVTLARNISSLRKALGDTPGQDQSEYIETVSKRGYRFIADVKELDWPTPPLELPNIKSRQNSRVLIALFGAMLLLVCIGVFWRFSAGRKSAPPIRSLAVLPLENLSNDPEQEYFVDGMTDELITNLAQIHAIRVISRSSVMQFKHANKTLPEIARTLNVDAIVEGSVARSGNNVHITAQLLDARQDRHLWAATYERQMEDVLGLQTQVARAIADQVKAKLTPEEDARLSKHAPSNPEAYDALLQGRFLMSRRNSEAERLKKAIAYFQRAVAIDPNNAEAWAALGDGYASLGGDYEAEDPAVTRPKARSAIARALELDPNLAEAYIASGWLKMFDWGEGGAERDFKRAIELNPNNSAAHRRYAFYLDLRGRINEALAEDRLAIDLAPLDIVPQALLARIYGSAGMADKQIAQANRVLELDPTYTSAYLLLGDAYSMKGEWSKALGAYEHIKEIDRVSYLNSVAWMWGLAGSKHQAEAAMAELKEFSSHNYVSPTYFAAYEARFGDPEVAFQWLQKAYREHDPQIITIAEDDRFKNLRSDSRFQDLVRRIEVP
jgi:TolB-like protein/DNA-binding winged helix-turn-helix (wHTH) protein/Tfp pilus assembly protein PilF